MFWQLGQQQSGPFELPESTPPPPKAPWGVYSVYYPYRNKETIHQTYVTYAHAIPLKLDLKIDNLCIWYWKFESSIHRIVQPNHTQGVYSEFHKGGNPMSATKDFTGGIFIPFPLSWFGPADWRPYPTQSPLNTLLISTRLLVFSNFVSTPPQSFISDHSTVVRFRVVYGSGRVQEMWPVDNSAWYGCLY